MGLLVVFIVALLGQCIAFEIFEEEKRQQLYPFPRIGRSSIWDFVEDKRLGGLMPFPRVGRTDGKRQGLIPFPRIGRSIELDYDDTIPDLEDLLSEAYDINPSPLFKRARFQPRIGRRKRSIEQDEDSMRQSGSSSSNNNNNQNRNSKDENSWPQRFPPPHLRDIPFYSIPDADIMMMPARMMRGMFNPRIGKKFQSGDYGAGDNYDKRALIPRVGRGDPSIQTRAMFQPRIGRALIPRVGRSGKQTEKVATEESAKD